MVIRRVPSVSGPSIDFAAVTHPGQVRSHNEDAVAVLPVGGSANVHAMVVADGMGGHRGGMEASRLAIATLERELAMWQGALRWSPLIGARIRQAFDAVNQALRRRAAAEPRLKGMGTTLVLGLVSPESVIISHAGDSQAFRLRRSQLRRLTVDHTLRGQFEAKGRSLPDAVAGTEGDSLLRALGLRNQVEPSIYAEVPEPGDVYLFCSDGLTHHLPVHEIGRILARDIPVDALAHELVKEANRRGGHDNISVALACFSRSAATAFGRLLRSGPPKDPVIQAVPTGAYDPTNLPPVMVERPAGARGRRRNSSGPALVALGLLVLSMAALTQRASSPMEGGGTAASPVLTDNHARPLEVDPQSGPVGASLESGDPLPRGTEASASDLPQGLEESGLGQEGLDREAQTQLAEDFVKGLSEYALCLSDTEGEDSVQGIPDQGTVLQVIRQLTDALKDDPPGLELSTSEIQDGRECPSVAREFSPSRILQELRDQIEDFRSLREEEIDGFPSDRLESLINLLRADTLGLNTPERSESGEAEGGEAEVELTLD